MRFLTLVALVAGLLPLAESREPDAIGSAHRVDGALAGDASVWVSGADAFTFPASVLDRVERRAFVVGNAFFKENWVSAPASTEGRDGLGPLFVARSCSTCHLRDGRGRPPVGAEPDSSGLIFGLGVRAGTETQPHRVYGAQLQDRSLPGLHPEAQVRIRTTAVDGRFADGEPYRLEHPVYTVESEAHGPMGDDVVLSPRVATQLVGLGLLEAIAEDSILARSDPADRDGDGISGRPSFVRDLRSGRLALGRFGWQATQPTVEQQVARAFREDLGITSTLFPKEPLTPHQGASVDYVSGGAPELDDHKLQRLAFYCRVLAVPAQRTPEAPEVRRGESLFETIGCASCHVPVQTTGDSPELPAYAGQRIRPYTDLLLHDMGPALGDRARDGRVMSSEWRTPPLWGIGLFAMVNGHTRYLHDGRARSLVEAILWHGGEASPSRTEYERLTAADRAALVTFLNSL